MERTRGNTIARAALSAVFLAALAGVVMLSVENDEAGDPVGAAGARVQSSGSRTIVADATPAMAPAAPAMSAREPEQDSESVAVPHPPVPQGRIPDRETHYYEYLLYHGGKDADWLRKEVAATLWSQDETPARRVLAVRAACVRLPDEADGIFHQLLSAPPAALGAEGDKVYQGVVDVLLARAPLGETWRAKIERHLLREHPWTLPATRQRAAEALFAHVTPEEQARYSWRLDAESDPVVLKTMHDVLASRESGESQAPTDEDHDE